MLNFGTFWFNQNTGAEILTFWEISKNVKIQKKKTLLLYVLDLSRVTKSGRICHPK